MSKQTISDIEKEIQERADNKDSTLEIIGLPKDFLFREQGFKIFSVDSEWIRNNLDVNFGSGGHGKVHSFIPNDEIWILTDGVKDEYAARTIIHEIIEFKKMSKLPYYHAHKSAMKEEFENSAKVTDLKNRIIKTKKNRLKKKTPENAEEMKKRLEA